MEPKFQTSFIPKKSLDSSQVSGIDVIHSTNIFSVIATVVFIVTLLASVGLFFYKNLLTNQKAEAEKSIVEARAAFEPEKIQQLIDANDRIISAKNLLEKHITASRVLFLMGDLVLKKMRFTEFNYVNKDGIPSVTIMGEVQTYNALAEQQNIFLKNDFIKNPVFTDFNLADNGYIVTKFLANIDPDYVSYKKTIEATPIN